MTTLIQAGAGDASLRFYNGSMPGSTLAYHLTRIPKLLPEPLDLLIVNSGHNYEAQESETYVAEVQALAEEVRAEYEGVEVVVSSQIPSFSDAGWPAANVAAHAARLSALRSKASTLGYGYIPVFEAFHSQPDGGRAWVMADGIHPLADPTGEHDGSALWLSQVMAYFDAL